MPDAFIIPTVFAGLTMIGLGSANLVRGILLWRLRDEEQSPTLD